MRVERYDRSSEAAWDAFVRASRNATFLLTRPYMDYHADRFADYSFIVRDPEGELVAVLPAHSEGTALVSHGGLSYGGFVIGGGMKTPLMLRVFESVLLALREQGFTALTYKTIPHIYHRQPAEEDRYALFLSGAELIRRDLLSVVSRENRLSYQARRTRGIKRAQGTGVTVTEEMAFTEFWDLLAATLADRFNATPVHSLAEICLLQERFPANIRLFSARSVGGELLAGVVIYQSERVAHAQYIASSPAGRDAGALDLVFDYLLNQVYKDQPYFDFGGSHEERGRTVNLGLIEQKEGFGARAVAHDHYRIDLTRVRPGILTGALK
jgi:hypothetical protein